MERIGFVHVLSWSVWDERNGRLLRPRTLWRRFEECSDGRKLSMKGGGGNG